MAYRLILFIHIVSQRHAGLDGSFNLSSLCAPYRRYAPPRGRFPHILRQMTMASATTTHRRAARVFCTSILIILAFAGYSIACSASGLDQRCYHRDVFEDFALEPRQLEVNEPKHNQW